MFQGLTAETRRLAASRRASAIRNQSRPRSLGLESLEARQLLSGTPVGLQLQVVNDAAANVSYRYADDGTALGSSPLSTGDAAPRGAASTIVGDKTWVIDANRNVFVYDTSGGLLGSWTAGSMVNGATPEGIATNGIDVWIVDGKSDKVFKYAGAAGRLSGSQNAASSFNLNSGNRDPKDIVTDGAALWVVNDSSSDKVFKYTTSGSLVGSWTISSANSKPTGITLDPSNIGDLWIADSGTDRVYRYAGATSRTSGSQAAAASFALATGNGNPQGIAGVALPPTETPHEISWVRQFGTAGDEVGRGVSTDSMGNVYVSGWTTGSLEVANPTGQLTPFLSGFDADDGTQHWIEQPNLIPGEPQEGVRVAADSLGNIFQGISGGANASLDNYGPDGTLRWSTPLPSGENLFGVAADDLGFAYVSSYNSSGAIFVRKVDGQTGAVVWERTLATGGANNTSGLSADGLGNVYVTGYTYGALLGPNAGGADAFIAKYTDAGDLLWTRQFGSAGNDFNFEIATDALGNIYTSGSTFGSLGAANVGGQDIFLAKYNAAGVPQWFRQLGTSAEDAGGKLWADGSGSVYIAGSSEGSLGGPNLGGTDIVLGKYDANGNRLWVDQFGTSGDDIPSGGGLAGDQQGNLFITGRTSSSWGAPNAGGADVILIKLSSPAGSGSVGALASLAPPAPPMASPGDSDSRQSTTTRRAARAAATHESPSATLFAATSPVSKRTAALAREQVFATFAQERNFAPAKRAIAAATVNMHDDVKPAVRAAHDNATPVLALDAVFARVL